MNQLKEIPSLISPLINAFKVLSDEWKHFFEIGIGEYLEVQTEKYYFTNTFIHRSEKVQFPDIYYPIKANYKKLTTDFNDIDQIFEDYKNITIVGGAGSGKTTLLKHIFFRIIHSHNKIPLLIELRSLNEYNGDLEKLISEKFLKAKVKPSEDTFKRALGSGKFIFLFDGYDEIFSIKKQDINRQIELFIDSYSQNNFLITTRPGSGIEGFSRFYDFKVLDLNDDDVKGFISKIVEDKERSKRILDVINQPKSLSYMEYLRNPLLLSMFIMAFENHPEIPAKKSSFYRNVFDTLYSKHDGIVKNSFLREKRTKLQRDDFEKILSVFCYLSLIAGKYSFTEEYLTDTLMKVKKNMEYNYKVEDLIFDLRTTISIILLEGFEYRFPHRSMQEYFTAHFISNLPTEKKSKVYNNLLQVLEKSSADRSFNLWSICEELDYSPFISNFILPQLRKYARLLSVNSDEDLLDAYIDITKMSIRAALFAHRLHIYENDGFFNSLMKFCDLNQDRLLYRSLRTSGAEKVLLSIAKPSNKFGILSMRKNVEINPESKKILIEYKICDIISDYKKNISDKILFYEEQIRKTIKGIDDLLEAS